MPGVVGRQGSLNNGHIDLPTHPVFVSVHRKQRATPILAQGMGELAHQHTTTTPGVFGSCMPAQAAIQRAQGRLDQQINALGRWLDLWQDGRGRPWGQQSEELHESPKPPCLAASSSCALPTAFLVGADDNAKDYLGSVMTQVVAVAEAHFGGTPTRRSVRGGWCWGYAMRPTTVYI